MKNKLICFILTFVLAISSFSVIAVSAEESESAIPDINDIVDVNKGEKVTIAFKIGDSTLSVNGQNVTVTTPYEKNGTTLVPVRVITEAFGATVDWDEAEEKVTLTYSGVTIEIWIGSTRAVVNGTESTLLLAPELTNETTMVPLRFITENFGADVSYDDATEAILVEKYITESNSITDYSSILHNTGNELVGDSYYFWSMKYSPSLNLAYRDFSGTINAFATDDESSEILVLITPVGDKTEEQVFESCKNAISKYTVAVQKEEKDAHGNNYLYYEAKTSDETIARKVYVRGLYVYDVIAYITNDASAADKETVLETAQSFDAYTPDFSNVSDLSEVNNNQRVFESKDFNFKVSLPADIYNYSSKEKINVFDFVNTKTSGEGIFNVTVSVQSKDNQSVSAWIENDYNSNKNRYNSDYAQFSEIQNGLLAGNSTKYYTAKIQVKEGVWANLKDIFFELDDYVYNVSIRNDDKSSAQAEITENSFDFKPISKSKIGSLMITAPTDVKTEYQINNSASFSASNDYVWNKPSADSIHLLNVDTLFEISIAEAQSSMMKTEDVVSSLSREVTSKYRKISDVRPCTFTQIGGVPGYIQVTEIKDDKDMLFMLEISAFTVQKHTFYAIRFIPSMYYGATAKNELNEIVSSIKIK